MTSWVLFQKRPRLGWREQCLQRRGAGEGERGFPAESWLGIRVKAAAGAKAGPYPVVTESPISQACPGLVSRAWTRAGGWEGIRFARTLGHPARQKFRGPEAGGATRSESVWREGGVSRTRTSNRARSPLPPTCTAPCVAGHLPRACRGRGCSWPPPSKAPSPSGASRPSGPVLAPPADAAPPR